VKVVEHDDRRYLLVKRSSDSSRVRDPGTGEETYLPTEELTAVDDGPLETAAAAVPDPVRALVAATHGDRGLGLLVELSRSPLTVRELMGRYDLCESDALGMATEFRAAGLVAEVRVGGERGYELTETGEAAVEALADLN
jgi:hypothetical protein